MWRSLNKFAKLHCQNLLNFYSVYWTYKLRWTITKVHALLCIYTKFLQLLGNSLNYCETNCNSIKITVLYCIDFLRSFLKCHKVLELVQHSLSIPSWLNLNDVPWHWNKISEHLSGFCFNLNNFLWTSTKSYRLVQKFPFFAVCFLHVLRLLLSSLNVYIFQGLRSFQSIFFQVIFCFEFLWYFMDFYDIPEV